MQVRDAGFAQAADGRRSLRLYAELPYSARFYWPGWVTGRRPRHSLDLDTWLDDYLPDGISPPGEGHRLPRRELRRKRRAIRAYRTQHQAFVLAWRVGERRLLGYEASFAARRPQPAAIHR